MTGSKHSQDTRQTLDSVYPGEWALGLIKVCSATKAHKHKGKVCQGGKTAIEKEWNKRAMERYREGLAARDDYLNVMTRWMEEGKNVGLCPPPNIVIVDCDNEPAVRFFMTMGKRPYQQRTADSAHFVWQMPDGVQYKNKNGLSFEWKDEVIRFDLRVGGRGMIVAHPSIHTSGTHTSWIDPLPEEPEDVPILPERAQEIFEAQGCIEQDFLPPEPKTIGEMAGHDQLLLVVNRFAPRVKTVQELIEIAHKAAAKIYANRPGRLEETMISGGECDRIATSSFEKYGGTFPLSAEKTDEGRALAHREHFGESVFYVPQMKNFMRFDHARQVWEEVPVEVVCHDFTVMQEKLFEDAQWLPAGNERDQLLEHSRILRNVAPVKRAAERLKHLYQDRPEAYDANPNLWQTKDGWVLDLRDMTARRVRMSDKITRRSGADFNVDADWSAWEKFLRDTINDEPTYQYFWKMAGMMMLGSEKEHVLPFLYGESGTGKSTAIHVIRTMFGEYGYQGSFRSIVAGARNAGNATADLYAWRARRFVALDEIADDAKLDAIAKSVTGDESITVRGLYRDEIDIPITWTVLGQGNKEPRFDASDPGIERRIVEIPFEKKLVKPPGARDLKWILTQPAVLQGIQAWAIEGCKRYQADGLGLSPKLEKARADLLRKQDPLVDWIEVACAVGPQLESNRNELWADFERWQFDNLTAVERLSRRAFDRLLKSHFGDPVRRKVNGKHVQITGGVSLVAVPGVPAGPTHVPGTTH